MTVTEALFALVPALPAAALVSIPWSVLRRERALLRLREIRRRNPYFDSMFRVMDSLAKLGITAREASKGMKRMRRAFRK